MDHSPVEVDVIPRELAWRLSRGLDAGVRPVSGACRRCGPRDLCLYLLCSRPDLIEVERGSPLRPRHAVHRSARHQPQRRPVEARERIGQYMDVSGWGGTRVTQNLDVEVVRSAAGVSGRSQS